MSIHPTGHTRTGRDKQETRERRQTDLLQANGKLMALNARLGIQSTLQTTMPTTGVDAFIGVPTGYAVVRIDQLENLADQIAEACELAAELERWQQIDRQSAQ